MSLVTFIDLRQDRRWDDFVAAHPNGLICHLSGWKQVLEQSFSHIKGFYLALIDPASGDLLAGLPVYLVNSFVTGKRLVSIPFATLSDPLAASDSEIRQLLSASQKLAIDAGASRIEIRTQASARMMNNSGFCRIDSFKHHFLVLDEPAELLARRFARKSIDSTLKQCKRHGLKLANDCNYDGLSVFFSLYVKTRKRLGLPPQPFRLFENLWQVFAPSGKLQLLHASYGKRVIASMLLLKFKDRVSWEFIGDHPEFRHLHPTHFLVWEAIKLSCAEGYKVFDFGRTAVTNIGLMDFKRRWGTVVGDLPQFWFPPHSNGAKALASETMKYRVFKRLMQSTPEALLPLVGKLCYRHMG